MSVLEQSLLYLCIVLRCLLHYYYNENKAKDKLLNIAKNKGNEVIKDKWKYKDLFDRAMRLFNKK